MSSPRTPHDAAPRPSPRKSAGRGPQRRAAADAERLALLAEAGEALGASLDYEQTLGNVARLAVGALADFCIVDVVEDGEIRRVATAHADPDKSPLLEELRRRFPPRFDSPQPAARVLRSGAPELLSAVTPEVIEQHSQNAEHAALMRRIGLRSHLAVPLVARGQTIGAISLGITSGSRRYGDVDVVLAQDLARLAALAIDNARLHRAAQLELHERREAESRWRLSEQRLRAVIDQSPLSIQIFDATGTHVRVNRAWEDLWGVTLEQVPDYNILEDAQLEALGVAPYVRRAFAGEAVQIPAVRYDPNATVPDRTRYADPVRWVRAFAYPVKNDEGRVREVVLVHEDVTAARHAEEQVRRSEARLRLALTAARMNVWDWDLASDVVECSDNAVEFWGRRIGSAADFLAVVHPDDVHVLEEAGRRAHTGADSYFAEYRLVTGGSPRWVQSRGSVHRDSSGKALRLVGVTLDISDLKAAEQMTRLLADAGETLNVSLDYQETLQSLTEVIVPRLADWCAVDLLTEAGTLERVAVRHQDPARVAAAMELFKRYPPRRTDPHGGGRVLATGETDWSSEISDAVLSAVAQDEEQLRLLGTLGLRSYVCAPMVARGIVIGVLSLVQAESGRRFRASDVELVTELARRAASSVDNARLYERLREEDRRKDEFLATLAHELRNPLAPIRTGLALLRTPRGEEAAERTRQIMERQLGHMVRLIDDLLDLSRVTRGQVELQRERVDLWSVVGAALETSRPLIDSAGLELVVRLPETPLVLDADRTRLAQVVSNLLNNAAKYTEPGGRIELDAQADAHEVIVRVADTGVGIPPAMLSRVFDMFMQVPGTRHRSQGGLGIGLTLVRRLVELHGGQVWAESGGEGLGSTFYVRLPVMAAPPAADVAEGRATMGGRSAAARRVLVVDDNADAAEMLAALLTGAGHEVRVAGNGPDALALAREEPPDVALLDIGLPGMTGYEIAARFREDARLRTALLVAVTGWGQAEDRRQAQEAGFDQHLTKPVDPREVLSIVAGARQTS